MWPEGPKRSALGACLALTGALLLGAAGAPPAQGSAPLFAFTPIPAPTVPGLPPQPKVPPPNGYLNRPCGVAVDSLGRFYIADHQHRAVDVYNPKVAYDEPGTTGKTGFVAQLAGVGEHSGPCGLALDSSDDLYVLEYHRRVLRYEGLSGTPPSFGGGAGVPITGAGVDGAQPTGIAVDPDSDGAGADEDVLYVNNRTHVAAFDSAGDPVMDGAEPLRIGLGTLGDGYGLAVSQHTATLGRLYVPDAASGTVKVYDLAVDTTSPVAEIEDPFGNPFSSLREAAIAVDRVSGDVYVADNTQPEDAETPRATIHVYSAAGGWRGQLRHMIVDALPPGLAVDNGNEKVFESTQGRVYVSSGNTHAGGVYAYPPGAATKGAPLPPSIPSAPLGGGPGAPHTEIGGALPGGGSTHIGCDGDACQVLPPEPRDPTLTTLLPGPGNPGVRYRGTRSGCRPGALARGARRLSRRARGVARKARRAGRGPEGKRLGTRAAKLRKKARRRARAARRCRREARRTRRRGRRGGGASASAAAPPATAGVTATAGGAPAGLPGTAAEAGAGGPGAAPAAEALAGGLLSGAPGFAAAARANGGGPAVQAGSHPYRLALAVGLDQGGGAAHLRDLRLELPAGLLVNPATIPLCSSAAFGAPRSSPFESESGESCPDRTQVGTVEATTGAGETRRFGLFQLAPPDSGVAARFGAAPYGSPLVFDARMRPAGEPGAYGMTLRTRVPQALQLRGLELELWGTPWDASHNGRRGNCLNEAEPGFPWAWCSAGEPLTRPPLAFLTLPTRCGGALAFAAAASSWQGRAPLAAGAVNRDDSGQPAPLGGCAALAFDPRPEGQLTTAKASSASGFVFRLAERDPSLVDPRHPIRSLPRRVVAELPDGTTINPSLGAGLEACSPGDYADESAFNGEGAGCPDGSKIGDFEVRSPYYTGFLDGSIYLAEPRENPFDSLLAVYLVAKSAQRGLLFKVPVKLRPDRREGTIVAIVDELPQMPFTELEVSFRSGQRAPLVTPPRCGDATTRIEMTPWAAGAPSSVRSIDSRISSGIGGGPCPSGTPPFAPEAIAGGVNSNVNSYTPYFVRLSRRDTEQEITSYSLVLPKGITGKLAGVPFCPEGAIVAARGNEGFAETARPSCPAASQVGQTVTGYGVGASLAYAPGRIYLAGPHRGAPLSLVTVNAATVGPFDLGTVVVRSAFQVDPLTAQLRIDSAASDPIPHILEGIPLHLRDVRVHMDRPQFTHNPSSCEPSRLISTVTGSGASFGSRADDSSVVVSEHFQLLNCLTLGFRPRLGLRLRGPVRRGGFPALRATFVARGQRDSNLKRIEVDMPHQLFLAQNHIRGVCTRLQFAADRCPPNSVYGRAVAHTPLLDVPLRGNVYLRSSSNKLPDLVASLFSGAVRIDLVGRIGPSKKGGIRAFFDNLPDAPIERFTMTLRGGRRGLLTNSVNICRVPPRAAVKALGQNNRGWVFSTKLRGKCGKLKQRKRRAQRRRAARRSQRASQEQR